MISKNTRETKQIAETFLAKLLKNQKKNQGTLVVGLSGDLGIGKTAFIKSVAKYLGIKDKISSPTYVIMKKYLIKKKECKFFFHLDAYRLESEEELLHLGWKEIVSNKENLVFIEWPENILKIMPSDSKYIHITTNAKGHRDFKFK